jgi:(2R)-3-sulfolactate dehydrogenase (NADP+)
MPRVRRPASGQLIIAIDPGAFAGSDLFLDRLAVLARAIESDAAARLPGSRRLALRERGATRRRGSGRRASRRGSGARRA